MYKFIFGKPADGLERSVDAEDECACPPVLIPVPLPCSILTPDMLTFNQPPLTQHISIPKDMSQLSVEAFTAGIVEAVLDALDFVRPVFTTTRVLY